jgi:hypothetical protein
MDAVAFTQPLVTIGGTLTSLDGTGLVPTAATLIVMTGLFT